MTALDIRGISAAYGGVQVLHQVDLRVSSGLTAVLGASGCGKTTLLRIVAGFVTPTAGQVAVAGVTVVGDGRAVPPRRRGVGYVPQEGALFPHLSVAENVAFGLPRSERRRAARTVGGQVAAALDLVELSPELARRFPHELSGGQQQRVALARALAPRPALVLLDEPFASLDAGLREETGRSVVRALRSAGAAGILVTHDQGEALSLADEVAVMDAGVFLQVASPDQVYLAPADERVAAFLGHATVLTGLVQTGGQASSALGTLTLRETLPPGAVRLAVRAEQVQVQPLYAEGTCAEVLDVSFFGHDATIRARLDSGELVAARTPAEGVPAAGDRVRLQVVGDVVGFATERTP